MTSAKSMIAQKTRLTAKACSMPTRVAGGADGPRPDRTAQAAEGKKHAQNRTLVFDVQGRTTLSSGT